MNTTDDAVIRDFRQWLADTPIPKADQVSGHDKFVPLESLEMVQSFERDRGLYLQILEGPMPATGSTCKNRVRLYVGVRFFLGFESQARSLRDIPLLRERMRSAVAKAPDAEGIAGLDRIEVSGPLHDYQTILKGDLVTFEVALTYHVEVGP